MIWRTFQIVPKAAVASQDSALIHDLDMEKCEVEDTEFERDFELRIRGDCCWFNQDTRVVSDEFANFSELLIECVIQMKTN